MDNGRFVDDYHTSNELYTRNYDYCRNSRALVLDDDRSCTQLAPRSSPSTYVLRNQANETCYGTDSYAVLSAHLKLSDFLLWPCRKKGRELILLALFIFLSIWGTTGSPIHSRNKTESSQYSTLDPIIRFPNSSNELSTLPNNLNRNTSSVKLHNSTFIRPFEMVKMSFISFYKTRRKSDEKLVTDESRESISGSFRKSGVQTTVRKVVPKNSIQYSSTFYGPAMYTNNISAYLLEPEDHDLLSWMHANGLDTSQVQGEPKKLHSSSSNIISYSSNIGDHLFRRYMVSKYQEREPFNELNDKEFPVEFVDFEADLMTPRSEAEHAKIQLFDPKTFNYTALRLLLDEELQGINKRQGRFFDPETYVSRLPRFLTNLGKMLDIETVINEIETSIMSSVSCNACKGGVGLLQHYIEQGKTKDDIVRAASKLCTNFRIETPRVCFGIINLMSDEVVYVMENLVMQPDGICGFLIGEVCGVPNDPFHKWRVLFPPYPKPPVALVKPPKSEMPTYKVLQLSDTHFDPYYEEGSNADCKEPMCCRRTSGHPASEKAKAGKWGDYRKCDTPERTIRNMFANIARTHPDIDYILWTGDLPPHDIWNQTRDSNLKVLRQTVQQLFDFFPNVPVFPALGNHESAPVNSFPPPGIPAQHSVQWLYNELDRQWRRWLPPHTTLTVLKGGYYSVEVTPGFRIISLNMNFCNNKNWWLLLDSEDPADQLQWLVYELQAAELRNEKVHIIGHIPPGYHDCLKVWSHNFYTIVNRFEGIITGQFYGHTHFDEFELFYDPFRHYRVTNVAFISPSQTSYYKLNPGYRLYHIQGDHLGSEKFYGHTHYDEFEVFYENDANSTLKRPSSVVYVAPSVTTYNALNPGYRLYSIEGNSQHLHRVVDHETWIMDLDEANRRNSIEPRWYRLYSAREAYDMRSLLPVDWDNLIYRMADDDELFKAFYRFYWKNSPKRESCDSECKKRILCDLRSGRSNDREKTCAVVHERVEAQERSQWRTWLFSGISGTYLWIKSKLGL